MLKKSVLIFLVLLLSGLVIAQSNNSNSSNQASNSQAGVIDKAYLCLQNQIKDKDQSVISLQEAVFGVLALGSNQKLTSVIDSKIVTGNHWAESPNQIKDTAQVLLAYNRINKNSDLIESWILSNNRTATDLTWYLEIDIDNHESSSCTLNYKSESPKTIQINQDMTISGNAGSCLTIAAGGFWLRISNSCIDNNFSVSCDKDFTTSTLYQRTGSSTVFVSPIAHSTSALGTTIESVNSKCFSTTANTCDYEGTLWAALALDNSNNDITSYLPYLLALSESNQRFLPSSFLHILTDGEDQYGQLVQLQQQGKFWQAPNTLNNIYYDSALALLSLQGTNSIEVSGSKTYFEGIVTQPEGCWNNNNIRDTAFLLYAGWPRLVSTGSPGNGSGSPTCEEKGNSCSAFNVCTGLGGSIVDIPCSNSRICCSVSAVEKTCLEQSGEICSSDESCSGTPVSSLDGSCCLGSCDPLPQADACKSAGGECYDSCEKNEEQVPSVTCSEPNYVCCKVISTQTDKESNLGLWITILVILIALLVVGIMMRNKLKMLLFKSRNKPGSSPSQTPTSPGRPFPPFRGSIPYPRAQPRMINPSSQPQPIRRPVQNKDNEMEETMRKLKEMSK